MLRLRRLFAVLLMAAPVMLCAGRLLAVQPDEILKDPALEARARALSAELRCVVCQNQSIDDSNAPLARDLRLLVRERLQAGDSDEQVKRFVVDRYGTFVLLKPPFDRSTLLLWLTPLVVLGGAAVFMLRRLRSGGTSKTPVASLTREEEDRLRDLLADDGSSAPSGVNSVKDT